MKLINERENKMPDDKPLSSRRPNNVIADEKTISESDVADSIILNYSPKGSAEGKQKTLEMMTSYLKQEFTGRAIYEKYNVLIQFDPTVMVKTDADKIYTAVTAFSEKKPLLLVLLSSGGDAGSAYLIGKLCREYSNGSFVITVPRYAKSAATLLCCAANEIHLGSLSELGPIDPQIDGLPALGLKNSVEHIAELVKKRPESSSMFSSYLSLSLKLINLGYYERVAESAEQYAEKLLSTHAVDLPKIPQEIAHELVYKYKDHGFVIDKSESLSIFGEHVVKNNTDEYYFGNDIYKKLIFFRQICNLMNHHFYFIGSLDMEATITTK